jgi:hypothetical protein
MLKTYVMRNIRDLIRSNPGHNNWDGLADKWGIDALTLYHHLEFLRHAGFVVNNNGKHFWAKGSLTDIRLLMMGSEEPARPEKVDRTPVKPKETLRDKELEKELKKELKKELEQVSFYCLNVAQIQSRLSAPYPSKSIHKAVIRAGGSVAWSRGSGIAVYSLNWV